MPGVHMGALHGSFPCFAARLTIAPEYVLGRLARSFRDRDGNKAAAVLDGGIPGAASGVPEGTPVARISWASARRATAR